MLYRKDKHSENETHFACVEQLDKFGGAAMCCACSNHKCKDDQNVAHDPAEKTDSRSLLDVLTQIENIVSDDFCADMEWDLYACRLTTEKVRVMARKLGEVYKLAHSNNPNHSCYPVHEDWRG